MAMPGTTGALQFPVKKNLGGSVGHHQITRPQVTIAGSQTDVVSLMQNLNVDRLQLPERGLLPPC